MLLVIALVAVVGVFTVSVDLGTARAFRLTSDVEAALTLIRDAQHEARLTLYDTGTGVYLEEELLTVYVGNSYETRDSNYDHERAISADIDIELPLDIRFAHEEGSVSERYEIPFSDSRDERTLVVEESGLAYIAP